MAIISHLPEASRTVTKGVHKREQGMSSQWNASCSMIDGGRIQTSKMDTADAKGVYDGGVSHQPITCRTVPSCLPLPHITANICCTLTTTISSSPQSTCSGFGPLISTKHIDVVGPAARIWYVRFAPCLTHQIIISDVSIHTTTKTDGQFLVSLSTWNHRCVSPPYR